MRKRVLIIAGSIAVLALASVPSLYFYGRYRAVQGQLEKSSPASQQDAQKVIAQVGRLMVLPTDEAPTVAEVTDIALLKNQPFFAKAVNGDKVLVYTTAKKAILYRPSTNMIINVEPINVGSSSAAARQTPVPTRIPTQAATASAIPVRP